MEQVILLYVTHLVLSRILTNLVLSVTNSGLESWKPGNVDVYLHASANIIISKCSNLRHC